MTLLRGVTPLFRSARFTIVYACGHVQLAEHVAHVCLDGLRTLSRNGGPKRPPSGHGGADAMGPRGHHRHWAGKTGPQPEVALAT